MPRTAKGRKKEIKKHYRSNNSRCVWMKQEIEYVDYKDVEVLKNFISQNTGKILPRKITGTSAKFQRKIASAIKLSREAGFLPFVSGK